MGGEGLGWDSQPKNVTKSILVTINIRGGVDPTPLVPCKLDLVGLSRNVRQRASAQQNRGRKKTVLWCCEALFFRKTHGT